MHEEVLRLLLAALPKLGTAQLAHYLQETLKHSRKSRKCAGNTVFMPSHAPACCLQSGLCRSLRVPAKLMVFGLGFMPFYLHCNISWPIEGRYLKVCPHAPYLFKQRPANEPSQGRDTCRRHALLDESTCFIVEGLSLSCLGGLTLNEF